MAHKPETTEEGDWSPTMSTPALFFLDARVGLLIPANLFLLDSKVFLVSLMMCGIFGVLWKLKISPIGAVRRVLGILGGPARPSRRFDRFGY